ncbi:MAG: hypothetical protein R6U96_14055 [Promethearchaeia archaeon]
MGNNTENTEHKKSYTKKLIGKTVVLIAYAILLLFLYTVLMQFSENLFIVLLILAFILLTLLGPLLKPKKGQQRLYKKMFPKEKRKKRDARRKRRKIHEIEAYHKDKQQKVKANSLNYKYRKPLIRRCFKCNMILPSYVKKCPNCGTPVKKF